MDELIKHTLDQLGISHEEFEAEIEKQRSESPVNDLENIAFVEALQMQNINDLSNMVAMLMIRIAQLEGKVNA